jgi:phenylalanyl-tRNA synthetase beta chain
MKLGKTILGRFTDLPESTQDLRHLLDDVGVEVKRTEASDVGDVFTVELLANRGDHYCYAGVARELNGRSGAGVRLPESDVLSIGTSPVPLSIQTEKCSLYTITELVKTTDGDLDVAAKAVLTAAGLQSVTPPVDATNVANAELGQPSHAFDADTIVGVITVRESTAGETAWLLFTEGPTELPEGTLIIADDAKVLAVAGVIGCEESKTTKSTTRIFLESAAFDPVAVRKGARSLSIHTDSSARFERGSDASAVLTGAGRVVHLLASAGWEVRGTTGHVGDWADERRTIALEIPYAAAFLEYPLTTDVVRERLIRYGFAVSPNYPEWAEEDGWAAPESTQERSSDRNRGTLLVRVPPHRVWDVEFAADLYEDLAKSIGYNEMPEHLPPIDLGAVPSERQRNIERVEEVLIAGGFFEVFTDGFHGRDLAEKAGVTEGHPLAAHVETDNALDRGYSLLKNNALYQAVEAIGTNLRMRTDEVKAYEWTRTFHPTSTGGCDERHILWAICSGNASTPSWDGKGRPADAFFMKALVANMAETLRLPLTIEHASEDEPLGSLLHPHRQASIRLNGKVVGCLGEVHPTVLRGHKIKRARPVYLEISADALAVSGPRPTYVEPSAHHPILRSLAFLLPTGVYANDLAEHLRTASPTWLTSVDIVDEFVLDRGRAVTFALAYSSNEGSRSADEVNAVTEGLIGTVVAKYGDRGVELRA